MKVRLDVELTFNNDKTAKEIARELKKHLKNNYFHLELSLHQLLGVKIEDEEEYIKRDYLVEDTGRPKGKLRISALNKRPHSDLKRLGHDFAKTGAIFTQLIEVRGNGKGDEIYFSGESVVTREQYDELTLFSKGQDFKDLYLPNGRTETHAMLKSCISENPSGSIYLMKFISDCGKEFVYRGSELLELANAGEGVKCCFIANYQLSQYKGRFISLARRPMFIKVQESDAQ